ncbi:MAG TPA: M67 family metallopeptidase, partial [Acidimicrobiia bacterium]|nr:M67 family metallopeptidase [Acidimicrobiia bacterium]
RRRHSHRDPPVTDQSPWLRQIIAHALADAPLEACGLIAMDNAGRMVQAYPTRNASETPATAFTLSPDDHHAAIVDAESLGWRIGAVYHSHPRGPAIPSPIDLRAPTDRDWIHLIVGLGAGEPEVRGWRIAGDAAAEVQV